MGQHSTSQETGGGGDCVTKSTERVAHLQIHKFIISNPTNTEPGEIKDGLKEYQALHHIM